LKSSAENYLWIFLKLSDNLAHCKFPERSFVTLRENLGDLCGK
jgi:hypothetical protein